MKIRVLFYGQLRELFGVSEKSFTVPEGAVVQAVVEKMKQGHESSSLDWSCIKVAVNEEFSELSKTLQDQDTVVLLPPVSGG